MSETHVSEGCRIETDMPASIICTVDPALFEALIESLIMGIVRYCESNRVSFKVYVNEDGIVMDASSYKQNQSPTAPGSFPSPPIVPDSTTELSAMLLISDTRSLGIAVCKVAATLTGGRFNIDTSAEDTVSFVASLPT